MFLIHFLEELGFPKDGEGGSRQSVLALETSFSGQAAHQGLPGSQLLGQTHRGHGSSCLVTCDPVEYRYQRREGLVAGPQEGCYAPVCCCPGWGLRCQREATWDTTPGPPVTRPGCRPAGFPASLGTRRSRQGASGLLTASPCPWLAWQCRGWVLLVSVAPALPLRRLRQVARLPCGTV